MKKFLAVAAGLLFAFQNFANAAPVDSDDKPTCVLMKFTDDTRFDEIHSADQLSDLVMLRLSKSKKFNLNEKESEWFDEKGEKQEIKINTKSKKSNSTTRQKSK